MHTAAIGGSCGPNPGFEALDGQHISLEKTVFDGKTAGAPLRDGRFHEQGIPKSGGRKKSRTCIDQVNTPKCELSDQFRTGHAGKFENRGGAGIKKLKKTREVHDAQRIAMAPFEV